jgi:hypothetical protein
MSTTLARIALAAGLYFNDDFLSVRAETPLRTMERTCSELGLNHKKVKPQEL